MLYTFFISAGSFRTLLLEFEGIFYRMERVMFSTIPLLGASITTWFLCVELPSIDLPTCFSFTYAMHLLVLGSPTPSSQTSMATLSSHTPKLVLSRDEILTVYAAPIFYTPMLYIFVHHNVLSIDFGLICGLSESFAFSALLVLLCAERQMEYWDATQVDTVRAYLGYGKLLLAGILFFCVQRHPLFNELKAFAGLGDLMSTVLLCVSCGLVFVAVAVNRAKRRLGALISQGLINACIGMAAFLTGLIMDLKFLGLVVSSVGAICLAEHYRNYNGLDAQGAMVVGEFLVLVASFCVAFVVHTFVDRTLLSMNFYFSAGTWHYTIRDFCFLETLLAAIAVASPPLANHQIVGHALGYVSGTLQSGGGSASDFGRALTQLKGWLFFMAMQGISIAVAITEIVVREQDWQVK